MKENSKTNTMTYYEDHARSPKVNCKRKHYLKALFEHVIYILTASTSVQNVDLEYGYIV